MGGVFVCGVLCTGWYIDQPRHTHTHTHRQVLCTVYSGTHCTGWYIDQPRHTHTHTQVSTVYSVQWYQLYWVIYRPATTYSYVQTQYTHTHSHRQAIEIDRAIKMKTMPKNLFLQNCLNLAILVKWTYCLSFCV